MGGYIIVFKFYLQVPVAMAVTFSFMTTRAQAKFIQCRPSRVQGLLGMSKEMPMLELKVNGTGAGEMAH